MSTLSQFNPTQGNVLGEIKAFLTTEYETALAEGWLPCQGGSALRSEYTDYGLAIPIVYQAWTARTSTNTQTVYALAAGLNSTNTVIYINAGGGGHIASSTNAAKWTTRTSGTTSTIYGVAAGNNRFVYAAVSRTAYSTNGTSWTTGTTDTAYSFNAVGYGNGIFVSVASPASILRSTNGGVAWTGLDSTWTRRATTTSQTLWGVTTVGTNSFVAVGDLGSVVTSTNGISWTSRVSGNGSNLRTVAYGVGRFVYGGDAAGVSYSNNLSTWTAATFGVLGVDIQKIIYGNSLFIGGATEGILQTSTNGINWASAFSSTWVKRTSGTTSKINALVFAGTASYVFVTDSGFLYSSTNAINWTNRTSGTTSNINSITYGLGLFVYGGNSGALASSQNLSTWTARVPGVLENISDVAYGNSKFVFAANRIIKTSTNAVSWAEPYSTWTYKPAGISRNWKSAVNASSSWVVVGEAGTVITADTITANWNDRTVTTFTVDLNDVDYGISTYVAVGNAGNVRSSTNGIFWTSRTSGINAALNLGTVAFGNNRFIIAAKDTNIVKTSTNAISWAEPYSTWVERTTGVTTSLRASTWATGTYFVVGDSGTIITSTNLISWVNRTSTTYLVNMNSVAFGATRFVSVGAGGSIRYTSNLTNYTNGTSNTTQNINTVIYANSLFVYGANQGIVATSTDGIAAWAIRNSGTTRNLLASAHGVSGYLMAGTNAKVITSTNAISWSDSMTNDDDTVTYYAAAYGNGLYLVGGTDGILRTSTDVINWVAQESNTHWQISGLSYNSGLYVYSDIEGGVGTSTDGTNWSVPLYTGLDAINNVSSLNSNWVALSTLGRLRTSVQALDGTNAFIGIVRDIEYGGGVFVAVGEGKGDKSALVSTSTDGIYWTDRTPTSTNFLYSVSYNSGPTRFYAAGTGGLVYYSDNQGVTWSTVVTPVPATDNIITLSGTNGVEILGTSAGQFCSSTDSINWSPVKFTAESTLNQIVGGLNNFVIVGPNNLIRYSTASTLAASDAPISAVKALTYGNGLFINGGQFGDLMTSTDGSNWTTRNSGTTDDIVTLAYNENNYYYGTSKSKLGTSTNGIDWTIQDLSTTLKSSANINAITYDAASDTHLLMLENGVFLTSTDAINWSPAEYSLMPATNAAITGSGIFVAAGPLGDIRTVATNNVTGPTEFITDSIDSLAYGNGLYIASGRNTSLSSTNGTTWSSINIGSVSGIRAIEYGNSIFVAGGNSGEVRSSTNGVNWTTGTSNTTLNIQKISYGFGIFTYITNAGLVGTSTNGINWNGPYYSGGGTNLNDIATSSSGFISVGTGGVALTSTDGISGHLRGPANELSFTGVAYGNSRYVAVTSYTSQMATYPNEEAYRLCWTSTNAINWTGVNVGTIPTTGFTSATYGNGVFLIAGSGGDIKTSTDGYNWEDRDSGISGDINVVSFGSGMFYMGSIGGYVASSTNLGETWLSETTPTASTIYALGGNGGNFMMLGAVGGGLASQPILSYNATTEFPLPTQNFTDNDLQLFVRTRL